MVYAKVYDIIYDINIRVLPRYIYVTPPRELWLKLIIPGPVRR